MVNLIISKNRAMQLECLIRSMSDNFKEWRGEKMYILWRATTNNYRRGYEQLMKSLPLDRFIFIEETNFEKQIKTFLIEHGYKNICLGVDDGVCIDPYPYSLSLVDNFLDEYQTIAFSFRLGLNTTTQNYLTGESQEDLRVLGYKDLQYNHIIWNWKIRPRNENYGYPFSFDFTCYRGKDLCEWILPLSFKNPRHLESLLASKGWNSYTNKFMISPTHSKFIVNTVNCVQETKLEAGVFFPHSAESLNEKFLQGYVIDYKKMLLGQVTGCHGEFEINFLENV